MGRRKGGERRAAKIWIEDGGQTSFVSEVVKEVLSLKRTMCMIDMVVSVR